ncbi:hypothetical protein [Burkholderia territorii]|uniref:hypothetical protein n=1 Tax=Burkholderia territorii TaxID=1503055 RepID=UPI00075C9127|nr:hypothetical protein [Burkholderia territorii]KWA24792.1 hypothetical protein WT37_04365 [Burkholderia territorii]
MSQTHGTLVDIGLRDLSLLLLARFFLLLIGPGRVVIIRSKSRFTDSLPSILFATAQHVMSVPNSLGLFGYSHASIRRRISLRFSSVSSSKFITCSYRITKNFVTFDGSYHVNTRHKLSSIRNGGAH